MSQSTLQLDAALQQYLHAHSLREPAACRRLRERAAGRDDAHLLSSPEQVQLLALIARVAGARRVVEVGTYVGYTALWFALALGESVRVTAIDRDPDATAAARAAWREAGVADRIELLERDAADGLAELLDRGEVGTYDLAYLDADKEGQGGYFEQCLDLVHPGGLIAVDNTLWGGRVADPEDDSAATAAIRGFNDDLHGDERIDLSLVPIGDGLTLARRREPGEG